MDQFITSSITFWYTILVVFIIGRFFYFRNHGKKEYLFTMILLAATISIVCILISRVELSLGFALGIFAIFAIIRYRTTPISPREMTYIFLSAGIAAKNALAPTATEFYKILFSDVSLIILVALSEYFLFHKSQMTKEIVFGDLTLIHPDKREQLIAEINKRFGISDIDRIQVGKIDTVKDSARLIVTFKDPLNNNFEDI